MTPENKHDVAYIPLAPTVTGRDEVVARLTALGHTVRSWAEEMRRRKRRRYDRTEVDHHIGGRRYYELIAADLAETLGLSVEDLDGRTHPDRVGVA